MREAVYATTCRKAGGCQRSNGPTLGKPLQMTSSCDAASQAAFSRCLLHAYHNEGSRACLAEATVSDK